MHFGTWNKILGSIEKIHRFGGMDHLIWNLLGFFSLCVHVERYSAPSINTIQLTNTQICSSNFKLLNILRKFSVIFSRVFSEKASCYLPPPWRKCTNQRFLLTNALCWIYCLLSESELHNLGMGHDKRSKQSKVRLFGLWAEQPSSQGGSLSLCHLWVSNLLLLDIYLNEKLHART